MLECGSGMLGLLYSDNIGVCAAVATWNLFQRIK